MAKDFCLPYSEIAIYNCDSYFKCADFIPLTRDPSVKGIIPCSIESGDAWSFCKANNKSELVEVTEKNRISNLSSVGFYYFSDANVFFDRSVQYISTFDKKSEIYVAPFYNTYLKMSDRVLVPQVDFFKAMGGEILNLVES